jgi:hypothetical protein
MTGEELARQDIRLARSQIRNEMRFPLWITMIIGIALLVVGAMQESDVHSWLLWMAGAALIALSVGMWFAVDWARVGYGILGALVCAVFLVGLAVRKPQFDLDSGIRIFQALFWGWIAIYAFLPSTRRLFARAKGSAAGKAP